MMEKYIRFQDHCDKINELEDHYNEIIENLQKTITKQHEELAKNTYSINYEPNIIDFPPPMHNNLTLSLSVTTKKDNQGIHVIGKFNYHKSPINIGYYISEDILQTTNESYFIHMLKHIHKDFCKSIDLNGIKEYIRRY